RALTDEQLSTSLTATLAKKPKGVGWWVFAYGSLLWNPLFPVAEARAATIHGLHRRFCLRSLASRGTPDQPGLVLALEPGGACHGVVYRLPSPLALDELHLLWRREMVVGAYRPRWVQARAGDRRVVALTFVVRRDHVQYAPLSHDASSSRKCTAEAISSGLPSRRSGVCEMIRCRETSLNASSSGHNIGPGATALTRTSGASSRASECVMPTSAAFAIE